ncbi:MAG: Rhomboid protease GluP [Candidatus Izimaplasma bacterium HR2]|nr:MAG: Rhomboid protease GluP [Candidatus Izimaplasma bacterium HR2]
MSIFSSYGSLKDYYKKSPVSTFLIFSVFIMVFVTYINGGFDINVLLDLGALDPVLVKSGEYYRLFTVMFLHGSVDHFLGNTIIGIFVLSGTLERLIKPFRFAILYIVAGLGASLFIVYSSTATVPYVDVTVGASGAIFAVLGSLLYISIFRHDLIKKPERKSIYALIFIEMVFTFSTPMISIPGHVGGLVSGFILSFLLISRKTPLIEEVFKPKTYEDMLNDFDEDNYY